MALCSVVLLRFLLATFIISGRSSQAAHIHQREEASDADIISHGGTHLQPWVTVEADGSAETITPSVLTTAGATTISAPPPGLTQTSKWTLTVSGTVTTSTGVDPVATATGPGEAGSFMLCDNEQGLHAPFCQPEQGSTLNVGNTYYVTWDPTYFGSDNTTVQVEMGFAGGAGFASEILPGSRGFYSWNTTGSLDVENTSLPVTFSLVILGSNNSGNASRQTGPRVMLSNTASTGNMTSSSRIGVLVVALPSILGIAILIMICVVWSIHRKRTGSSSLFGGPGGGHSRSSQAHAERRRQQPRGHDLPPPGTSKSGLKFDLQLTNRDSWSNTSLGREPHPGRNVFREEMDRQNRQRG